MLTGKERTILKIVQDTHPTHKRLCSYLNLLKSNYHPGKRLTERLRVHDQPSHCLQKNKDVEISEPEQRVPLSAGIHSPKNSLAWSWVSNSHPHWKGNSSCPPSVAHSLKCSFGSSELSHSQIPPVPPNKGANEKPFEDDLKVQLGVIFLTVVTLN